MSDCDFNNLLLEAVDEGLSSLGESSKHAIYFHLEKSFDIRKQDIPSKIDFFADAIEKMFGGGANFLEILIMKHLYKQIGSGLELRTSQDLEFTEYVAAAKQSFLEKK